jgi:hypothetical protein
LLYQYAKGGTKVDLQGRQIRPATIQRFQEFSAAMERQAYDSEEGRQALARNFGDTFWYYFVSRKAASEQSLDRHIEYKYTK